MTKEQKAKYEEAANAYANIDEHLAFLAGATLAHNEHQTIIDDLYANIKQCKEGLKLAEFMRDQRYKDGHNEAIEAAIKALSSTTEVNRILEKLKL
jgi:hypothetical protein